MPLVRNGQIISDRFVRVSDDAAIPTDGAVLMPAQRFLDNAAELLARDSAVGVNFSSSDDRQDTLPGGSDPTQVGVAPFPASNKVVSMEDSSEERERTAVFISRK